MLLFFPLPININKRSRQLYGEFNGEAERLMQRVLMAMDFKFVGKVTRQEFTFWKSTVQTPEQCVKVFKVDNKDTRTISNI